MRYSLRHYSGLRRIAPYPNSWRALLLIFALTTGIKGLLLPRRLPLVSAWSLKPRRPPQYNRMGVLRVRSNLGTWKFSIDDESTHTVSDVVEQIKAQKRSPSSEPSTALRLIQPLSRDPGGRNPLPEDLTLRELGLGHGSMLFCRVEQEQQQEGQARTSSSRATGSSKSAFQNSNCEASVSKSASQESVVIDLIDSDDEEYENCAPSKANRKQGPPTKKRKASTSPASILKDSSAPSKISRQSETNAGTSLNALSKAHPSKFQIASYNVWFGPPDPTARQVHPDARMRAIAQELKTAGQGKDDSSKLPHNQLLFVGFQELTESLRDFLQPHLEAMKYKFCTQPLGDFYGVGLAISESIEVVDYKFLPFSDSTQRRGLLYVQTPTILFGTTHLESFVDAKAYNGVAPREAQIAQAASFCRDRLEEYPNLEIAILAGDFNWDDERKRKGTAPNTPLLELLQRNGCGEWSDAGLPFEYTYDGKENPMLGGNLRRRFDRCISLSRSSVRKHKTRLSKLGKAAIPGLTWEKKNPYTGATKVVPVAPSDHFGIAVTFEQSGRDAGS